MIRLNLIVEGTTEERFVKNLLAPHLGLSNVFAVARSVETSRRRGKIYRGGTTDYGRAKRDLLRWMKEDQSQEVFFSSMFDLYHLPPDFPNFEEAKRLPDAYQRVTRLEMTFKEDIKDNRFIPYIQLHEFEALILTDPSKFACEFINREQAIANMIEMCSGFKSPELINDEETTAPSKRIIQELPEYEGRKASAGPHIAREIGLAKIREKCPHFKEWLEKLEILQKRST